MVETCNLIALVVASNQPFYPLYVYLAVSEHIWPTFFTFLSTPLFLAVPALARRLPRAGRALLPLTGVALISATFFRPSERLITFILVGLAIMTYLGLDGAYGDPVHLYSISEYQAFLRLNVMSAGILTVFVGLVASEMLSRRP
jgi:hypothetical protein